jgi:uncharacterized membrane protein YhfC
MASYMVQTASSDWLATQIQIGRKSTLGCCFSLGTAVIAWRSQKQTRMVFLTTQGEHVRDRMEKGAVEVPV